MWFGSISREINVDEALTVGSTGLPINPAPGDISVNFRDEKMPFQIDERYIIQAEEKLGVKFPSSFREKMMKDNGGEVETPPDAWNLYPFFDSSDKKRIKRTCNDIICETNLAREWDNFPKEAIAVGTNGSGDQLIFIRSRDDPRRLDNCVFWWDYETGNINKVANDFSEIE